MLPAPAGDAMGPANVSSPVTFLVVKHFEPPFREFAAWPELDRRIYANPVRGYRGLDPPPSSPTPGVLSPRLRCFEAQ